MTRKQLGIIAVATVAVIGAGSVAAVWHYRPDPDRLNAAIENIGFYPITPPSILRGPGSIYNVSGDGRFYVMLCEVSPDRLKSVLRSSPTAKQVTTELSKAKVGIQAEVFNQLQSKDDANLLQSVKLELDEVEVSEVSLEDLATIADELMGRDSCRKAVESALHSGDYVCQGQQVLKATTNFSVAFSNEATASVASDRGKQLQTAKLIQAHVDGTARVEGDRIVSGKGLYYGMKLAPRCMYLPGERPRRPPITVWQRMLNQVHVLG